MDIFRYLQSRQIDLDSLFSVDEQPPTDENFDNLFISLGNALEKQIRTWWDICTIEHYLKERIILRSLRWEVTPQDGLDDPASMQDWLDFFNGVGLKLQQLVLERKKKKMTKLETIIKELQQQLEPIKDLQQYIYFNEKITKKLEKIDKDSQKKKLKKFYRDLKDFRTNAIYFWQNTARPTHLEGESQDSEPTHSEHTTQQPTQQTSVQRREVVLQQKKQNIPTHLRPGTPAKGVGNQSRGNRGRGGTVRTSHSSIYDHAYQVPVGNRFEPLWDQNTVYSYSSPRPFLGRGRGGQRRGRGFPPHRSRPPYHYYPPTTSTYKQNQWKDPYHWERNPPQQQNPRQSEPGDVEQDTGSKKRRRETD